MEKGLPPEEINEEFVDEALGTYLEEIGKTYSRESGQYLEARKAYMQFKRRWLA